MPKFWSDEEVIEAVRTEGSVAAAARKLGANSKALRCRVQRLKASMARRGYSPEHGLNTPYPDGYYNAKTTIQRGPEGDIERTWERMTADAQQQQELMLRTVEALEARVSGLAKPTEKPRQSSSDQLLAAYMVGDAHLGMRAWQQETGVEHFDTEIATNDLRGAITHLVSSAPPSHTGMLVNVGDFLHANDTTSQTPASKNLLDTDGRYGDVIDHAVEVLAFAIDAMLHKHQRVRVINARGNHDPDAALWLNRLIAAYYRREPRVEVIPNDAKFIYMRWGQCLVGIHHGDRIKRQQLYEAMTRDRRRDWGECDKSYFWTGHIHHKNAEEIGGCLFESFNTLAAPDSFHAAHGYGAGREMQCLILNKQHGIVARNVCSLEMARMAT